MTEGTKYHPLFEHLLFSGQGRLSMSFSEIEDVIGGPLPPSARRRQEWWSNSPKGHSQARAWMRASYRTAQVDLARETVDFILDGWPDGYRALGLGQKRETEAKVQSGLAEPAQAAYEAPHRPVPAHPLFGIWKGRVTPVTGYDYTQPAFTTDDP